MFGSTRFDSSLVESLFSCGLLTCFPSLDPPLPFSMALSEAVSIPSKRAKRAESEPLKVKEKRGAAPPCTSFLQTPTFPFPTKPFDGDSTSRISFNFDQSS